MPAGLSHFQASLADRSWFYFTFPGTSGKRLNPAKSSRPGVLVHPAGPGSEGRRKDSKASLTDRRIGENTIETFTLGEVGQAEIFRYTFHHPDTYGEPGGSLGNDIETIIGPGGDDVHPG